MILFVDKDTTLFRSSSIRYRGWLYQHSVGFLCNNAFSRHSAEIDIPQLFLYIQFATELGNLAVYGDAAHHRHKPVLFRGIAFEIEKSSIEATRSQRRTTI